MRCPICRQGETSHGTATVTLERAELTLVIKNVPALVCENCGEEFVDEDTTEQLLASAEDALRSGVRVDVRDFVAA